MSNVHLVVLGAGPGGYSAAFYAADQGYKVTLDKHKDQITILIYLTKRDVEPSAFRLNNEIPVFTWRIR